MHAHTVLERDLARDLDELAGFSVTGPIRVPFDRPIDARDLERRQGTTASLAAFDAHAIYLVDLETGLPEPLAWSSALFPRATAFEHGVLANDPRAGEASLLHELYDEDLDGDGMLDPGEDTDSDGLLDRPATADGTRRDVLDAYDRADFAFDRQSATLELRPARPLRPATTYAVVITDRVRDAEGRPARSPLDYVHPLAQTTALAGIETQFEARPDLYGDLATRGLSGVAFAWTFTTDATTAVAEALRDGLRGEGPHAALATSFGAGAVPLAVSGGVPGRPCPDPGAMRYRAAGPSFGAALGDVAGRLYGWDAPRVEALVASFDSVSHVVAFAFESPHVLGDPERPSADARIAAVAGTAELRTRRETIVALAFVPRTGGAPARPLVFAHDLGGGKLDVLSAVGLLAAHGVAPVIVDLPGHGTVLDETSSAAVHQAFGARCLAPAATALLASRARDVDGDGIGDSGAFFVSARLAHLRDAILQATLDEVALLRVLAAWDGRSAEPLTLPAPHGGGDVAFDGDLDGDGGADVAGDFDGDGAPDLGGRAAPSTAGTGLGGTVAALTAALVPEVETSAPIAMLGGLSDWIFRSADPRVHGAILGAWMGPVVVGVPSTGTSDDSGCTIDEVSLRIEGSDRLATRSMEVACIAQDELGPSDVLFVRDLSSGTTSCSAAVSSPGTFRAPVRGDGDAYIVLEIYRDALDVVTLGDCTIADGRAPDRVVATFEVVNGPPSIGVCEACARFGRAVFDPGDALRAPAAGLSRRRGSAALRELAWIAPALLDGADPVAWARASLLEREPPARVLVVASAADPEALVASSHAFARASGLLPFAPFGAPAHLADVAAPAWLSTRYGGVASPSDLLAAQHVVEGVSRFARHPVAGGALFVVDADDASDGRARFGPDGTPSAVGAAPIAIDPPLRFQRASRRPSGAPDDALFSPSDGEPRSALVHVVMDATGTHDVVAGTLFDGSLPFDASAFVIDAVGSFAASSGRSSPW
jgi:hypothetical protein